MKSLVDLYRHHNQPMSPIPTGESPDLTPLPGIRAVVFDIYGTLIISGTGDISLVENPDSERPIREALEEAGITVVPETTDFAPRLLAAIRAHQQARRDDGIRYPEVEIRDVWRDFIAQGRAEGTLRCEAPTTEMIATVAVAYEVRVNPVWPMPHLAETLAQLRARDLLLGIVSNGQFYTPLMFEAFLGQTVDALGFDPEARIFSHALLEGKPSTRLYEDLRGVLERRGISPAETFYIGNDLKKDIWPAQLVGFKTGLFAADQRSLRWRRDEADVRDVQPDRILTDLAQVITILGL